MVSMKMGKKWIAGAKKLGSEPMSEEDSYPEEQYPYGLEVTIEAEKWAEIASGTDIPQVGQKFEMCVHAVVVSVNASINNPENSSLRLQITDVGLMKDKKPKKTAAQTLYAEGE